ncbi:MAG: HypC/HybG/HupF family hydrogenase formation chaperone [Myxococcota bacterium]
MCLAVPGSVEALLDQDPMMRRARVRFGALTREVSLAFVPEAEVGDFVVVHAGFAISRLDPLEAARVFEALDALGALEEVQNPAEAEVCPVSPDKSASSPSETLPPSPECGR